MPTMTRGQMPTSGRLVTIPSANRTAHVCRPLAVFTVNDAAVRQYGYSRAEFLAMTLDDIHPSEKTPGLIEQCALPGNDCKLDPVRAGVYQHRKKDGTLMDADIICYPIPFNGRDAIFVLVTDLRERTLQRLTA
jgi:PAS domain-containing protein